MDDRFLNRPLFKNISSKSIKALEKMKKPVCTYNANDLIVRVDDPIDHICVVISGVLKSTEYTIDGKELNSSYFFGDENVIPGGDAFPFYLVYGGEKNYFFNTFCLKKAMTVWLPVKELIPIINDDLQFLLNVLTFVSQYTRYSRAMLRCVQYRKIADRIAFWLLQVNEGSKIVKIPNSQDVLANMLHVNRSSLNQALKQMDNDNIIKVHGREIQILDENKLVQMI